MDLLHLFGGTSMGFELVSIRGTRMGQYGLDRRGCSRNNVCCACFRHCFAHRPEYFRMLPSEIAFLSGSMLVEVIAHQQERAVSIIWAFVWF